MDERELIARRVAKEIKDGDVVNLGIGVPTLVPNYIPKEIEVFLQSENGIMGMGPAAKKGEEDKDLINAGGGYVTIEEGGCTFDSATSFGIIRGGHVDMTVLGALQVAENGDLANWKIPGKMVPGMGGAMDLVTGAKRVIIAMSHTQKGEPKILKKCTLPLTAAGRVTDIITEMGYMKITPSGLVLKEIAPGVAVEDIRAATEAILIIPDDLKEMDL
ncbi:MAG: CoA transferase subunit B [Deltaproteobacteria bacterium]|nr:CoA transferase subunit B [Deltaproteobacteria bacterium]